MCIRDRDGDPGALDESVRGEQRRTVDDESGGHDQGRRDDHRPGESLSAAERAAGACGEQDVRLSLIHI